MEFLLEHLGQGLIKMLVISMPVVLTAAGIGLVVGILQAVTQVQEQTIAAAPKILGVFIVLMALGGLFTNILKEYTEDSINLALRVIPKQDDFILPSSGIYDGNGSFFDDKTYSGLKKPDIKKIMSTPGKVPIMDHKEKQSIMGSDRTPTASPNFVESRKIHSGR